MIKRTLFFGNPAYLKLKDAQTVVELPELKETRTVPIEDIGMVVLEHPQITITHALLAAWAKNNVAVVTCAENYLPNGLLMPLDGHFVQNERHREQLEVSIPLKKQLWGQVVAAKIRNQALHLKMREEISSPLFKWAGEVKSGDEINLEARAAAHYWHHLFKELMPPDEPEGFIRDRYGDPPNNMLNYGYAILRAVTARSLVGAGLLPTYGIHHANRYNAYCLADDMMEPYRPFVDELVYNIYYKRGYWECVELNTDIKKQLLKIPVLDTLINGEQSPLMVATQTTAYSLSRCFAGETRKLLLPELIL